MKESSLSPSTRALLDAAKSDGPAAAARLKMWGALSTATGIAAAAHAGVATGATTAGTVAAAGSAKLLVAGAIFGSALTVGVALAVVRVVSGGSVVGARLAAPATVEPSRSTSAPHDVRAEEDAIPVHGSAGSSDEPPPIPLAFDTLRVSEGLSSPIPSAPLAVGSEKSVHGGLALVPVRSAPRVSGSAGVSVGTEDGLWRVSSLIQEAQRALRRKDPVGALASLDAARRVGLNQLEPEEMSVRARTLRALGREAEASDVEGQLKARYPAQALIR
jgi:hypothetical protein